MKKLFIKSIPIWFLLVPFLLSTAVSATTIDPSNYTLNKITGSFAWGFKDNNNVSGSGHVNNTSSIGVVQTVPN